MRVLYLGNNWLGWKVLEWLRSRGVDVAGLVLHPEAKRRFGKEMLSALQPGCPVFAGETLREPSVLERIAALRADLAVSVLFDYILRREFLGVFPRGTVNLHPALLPYNRGQYPNVWSIIEGTPAGATLHYVDEGVDTGDLIAQREVPVDPADTGESLYRKLERASLDLFQQAWPSVAAGSAPRSPQPPGNGTSHRTRDVEKVDEIDLDRLYSARDLINILRARTFPPYRGAYFRVGERRIYMRMQLSDGEEG